MSATRASLLAFLTAGVTLFTQVLVHRVVSAKLLNNYAFLVISLTMLGFAVSGAVLARTLPRFLPRAREFVLSCSALFVLSLLACSCVFYRAEAGAQMTMGRPDFVRAAVHWMPLALLYAIPFAFCGFILGILLAAPELPTRRIYAFDLVGSGLGALLVIPAISGLGVENALLLAGALQLAGAVALVPSRRGAAAVLAGVAAVGLLAAGIRRDDVFRMRYPAGSMLAGMRDAAPPYGLEAVVWDPAARIEVARIPPPVPEGHYYPCLIGSNLAFLSRFERMITQNNYAFTYAVHYDGNPQSLRGIEETIYSAAYQVGAAPRPRVLIIGVGGGFDILNALAFDSSEVTAVEINAATTSILTRRYRDYFRAWVEDPRLHLVTGEGRNYLATHPETYDVLQLSGVDSYSGTAGAAHVFSENYLYTAEAFDLYLSRLAPQGVLNVMRLEHRFPREMLRALVTAVASLRRAGVEHPSQHIMAVTASTWNFTALLVKKTPFTAEEEARLHAWADPNPFLLVSAGPRVRPEEPNIYQAFLDLDDPRREAAFVAEYPFDVSPATDDRPFFFNYAFWWHLFPSDGTIWTTVPTMEMSVLMLLVLVGLAAWACVHLPLRRLARSGGVPHRGRFALFFAAIAVGYLAVEVALLQKFGLFLGHPNYALSVVLAALLVATGLGSLFSTAMLARLGNIRFAAYLLAAVVLLEYLLVLPRLASWIGMPFALRAALVALLVAPIGVVLGLFLPSGLDRLKQTAPDLVPWAWGVNGIFSVMAPILSIALSMSWGIGALLLASLPVYLLAGFALPEAERSAA